MDLVQEEVDTHVARRIAASPLIEEPWPHIVVVDILPRVTYHLLLRLAVREEPRYVSGHRRYGYVNHSFSPGVAAFESEVVLDALEEKLGFRGFPKSRLVLDLDGYEFPIHTDVASKAGTLQLYLATGLVAGYGTRLHRGQPIPLQRHSAEIPYAPNLAYAFKRTDATFHSTSKVGAVPRRSLLVPYYVREDFRESGE